MSLMEDTVLPAMASLSPVSATMLPALHSSMGVLSAPTIRATVWTLWAAGTPEMYRVCPFLTVPENSLRPACP